ncbi:MAG: neutral/alkaline non-lysosomal ceramidase N-terminal domain-containing protein [Anaerolineaceae bacterium]
MVTEHLSARFLAGASEVDITPPIGGFMAGYAARTEKSQGIHDPLKAQALYLQQGVAQILILTCDMIGIDLEFTSQVRQAIGSALNISQKSILLACSHTHSGPQGFLPDMPIMSNLKDPVLTEITKRKLVGAAQWAVANSQPASLSYGCHNLTGLGKNRNDPIQGAFDSQLSLLRLDDPAKNPLAVLFNFGCHPTIMGYDNLQISADYPGSARQFLKQHFPACTFLFTNGASGDVSTRFTRREQGFNEVERMGLLLAGGVLQAMLNAEPLDTEPINTESVPVELPLRDFPTKAETLTKIEQIKAELERFKQAKASPAAMRKIVTQLEGARGQLEMASRFENVKSVQAELQFLRIGSIVLIGIPGEPFSQTVLDIKKTCRPRIAIPISYANDYQGYFPDQAAVEYGTYEALISPYDQRVSEVIYQSAVQNVVKD